MTLHAAGYGIILLTKQMGPSTFPRSEARFQEALYIKDRRGTDRLTRSPTLGVNTSLQIQTGLKNIAL